MICYSIPAELTQKTFLYLFLEWDKIRKSEHEEFTNNTCSVSNHLLKQIQHRSILVWFIQNFKAVQSLSYLGGCPVSIKCEGYLRRFSFLDAICLSNSLTPSSSILMLICGVSVYHRRFEGWVAWDGLTSDTSSKYWVPSLLALLSDLTANLGVLTSPLLRSDCLLVWLYI